MRLAVFFFTALLTLGCTKYQYGTINTDLSKSQKGEIILDNDTVLIRYRFSGLECPAAFQLYNKLSRPLRIDWGKSILVIKTRNWLEGTLAESNHTTFFWSEKKYPLREGFPNVRETITEVLPHSFLDGSIGALTSDFIKLSYPQMKSVEVNGESLKVQVFKPSQSPFQFESIISLSVDSADFALRSNFWVEEISEGFLKPEHYESYRGRDDKYFVTRTAGAGAIIFLIGGSLFFGAQLVAH